MKPGPEPHVAIFWLANKKVVGDTTPLSSAELYGDCLGHAISHIDYWTELQESGTTSRDIEYEENPRGRVVFNWKKEQFMLVADRCILAKKAIVHKIIHDLHLPSDCTLMLDVHYRCVQCLRRTRLL